MIDPGKRLHLGCGLKTPQGWIHLDGSWNSRLARYPRLRRALRALPVLPAGLLDVPWSREILVHDVRRPLPFRDNSMSVVYASHLLEHLFLAEARRLLRECWRVLEPAGVLRLVVPDLRALVSAYLDDTPGEDAAPAGGLASSADRLCEQLHFWRPEPPAGNLLYRIYQRWDDFQVHKWMYDARSLAGHMTAAGFVEARQMPLHQSRIESIEAIEDPSRVLAGAGICVEGVKPAEITL